MSYLVCLQDGLKNYNNSSCVQVARLGIVKKTSLARATDLTLVFHRALDVKLPFANLCVTESFGSSGKHD